MSTLSLRVKYRPIRIGWCVEGGNREQFRRALRFTHSFAGGRFNPLIPVDAPELAENLLDRFRVDVLSRSQTKGYAISASRASGQQRNSKMHQTRNFPTR
jgi:hypothetical protein